MRQPPAIAAGNRVPLQMVLRSLFFLVVLVPMMLVGIPLQFLVVKLGLGSNGLPRLFHRLSCVFLGMRVKVIGRPAHNRPTLIVSNHISWTDIVAIGSVADVAFVAKSSIGSWPFVGFMASLQRTIYVDYNRRADTRRANAEMAARLGRKGAVLLFAEGHRDLGTHVLPFRSALIGAAQAAMSEAGANDVAIQPMTIAYTRLQGLPVSRADRGLISGIGARSFGEVVRVLLTSGSKEVTLAFAEPRPLTGGEDRKRIAREAEEEVRRMLVALNRGRALAAPAPEPVAEPAAAQASTMQN